MTTTAVNTLREMFDDCANDVERASKLDMYKSAMAKSAAETESGQVWMNPGDKTISRGVRADRAALIFDTIEKSLGADGVAALSQDLATLKGALVPDLQKDWTPTNPIASGLVPYDLEAPAKVLVPKYTPLRNTIPRQKGQGNARQYKRITAFTNSGQSVASVSPFFNSSTATSTWGGPGNLTLNRPQKISYAGDNQTRSYCELGFSDQVNFKAQFQGLGFDNLRALSHTAVLWAHLMGEERAILFGRGATSGGYLGSVSAPGSVTSATATTGGTIAAATYSLYVVAYTGFGQSAPSTVATQVTTGATSTITVTIGTEPAGAIYYGLYAGTSAGITNTTLQTTFIGNTVTITAYTTSGVAGVAADSSFSADAYDGFYTVQSDTAQSGYFRRLNGALSSSNPGSEFDTALAVMWAANGADPDEIWMTGTGRTAYGQYVRNTGNVSGYRTSAVMGDNSMTMGASVTGHVNPNSGKVLDLRSHRFALPGTALIRSLTLPLQDAEVPAPVAMTNVQDYMALDWPIIQLSYDVSTYQMGTMIHYAPAWSGLIAGITNG
jgi:hypothetical protein